MMDTTPGAGRRGFLRRLSVLTGASAVPLAAQARTRDNETSAGFLPAYVRAQKHRSLKQSSHDIRGGNADYWRINAGATREVFSSGGPGAITHIWFTIDGSQMHLKELVLRAYWEGNDKPSVETPVGDFFGLNLGDYQVYESAYLACSPGRSLNCYFAMPFRESARLTVTNEGSRDVSNFYSNIDYLSMPELPGDALYFHAQYRQSVPCRANTGSRLNLDGEDNYVLLETRGSGHLMGVTLGVQQNSDGWMGEGDDMIFVDDVGKPIINGTGAEDYFLGSWGFGGKDAAVPFSHHFYGCPVILMAEQAGGRYCCYRWHGENPVTFTRGLKHTLEHGHANDRADNYFSVGYWYQREPFTDFPSLPPVKERIPRIQVPAEG